MRKAQFKGIRLRIVVIPTALFYFDFQSLLKYYAEVPYCRSCMTTIYCTVIDSYVPTFPYSDRLFVFFLSFAAARPFALRPFAAFMSFGAVVRSCLIWDGSNEMPRMDAIQDAGGSGTAARRGSN